MSGPPPKPAELRLIEGNPSKRPIPRSMKCRPLVNKKPPTILGRAGRAEWKRVMDTVGHVPGLIQEQDRPALTALCLTWEQYLTASEIVQKAGVLIKSQGRQAERPNAVRNPAIVIARDCLTNLLALWARFGMTPSDRSRLEAPKDDDHENPLQEIIAAANAEAAARRRTS
jgi:P27 family predicted phage terminase small subunit